LSAQLGPTEVVLRRKAFQAVYWFGSRASRFVPTDLCCSVSAAVPRWTVVKLSIGVLAMTVARSEVDG
jgi:hypothetical protein